ncbi:LysR family transcriptional regulator [Caballeronia catudaia]|uniref:LysR family transcriptional regulator n=1 Tax=Caballeronia catudaia TaxID=1777136 RepID=A0A158BMX9_9BURK|nr:LysR family transcriptional regulator [Caballeronia catudaia]SAK71429.1 LysR family transcriptional regulator [Caballeronia catudaia]
MDSRYLQSFVFVVELGSIAEAARRLDLTPAAVAQRVKMLEAELGATLVRRSGRTVGATEAGERILARARTVLHDIRDLRADIDDTDQLGGQLRLGGMATMMAGLIPDALAVLLDLKKWALPHAAPKRFVGLLWGRSSARLRLVQAFLAAADSIERH